MLKLFKPKRKHIPADGYFVAMWNIGMHITSATYRWSNGIIETYLQEPHEEWCEVSSNQSWEDAIIYHEVEGEIEKFEVITGPLVPTSGQFIATWTDMAAAYRWNAVGSLEVFNPIEMRWVLTQIPQKDFSNAQIYINEIQS